MSKRKKLSKRSMVDVVLEHDPQGETPGEGFTNQDFQSFDDACQTMSLSEEQKQIFQRIWNNVVRIDVQTSSARYAEGSGYLYPGIPVSIRDDSGNVTKIGCLEDIGKCSFFVLTNKHVVENYEISSIRVVFNRDSAESDSFEVCASRVVAISPKVTFLLGRPLNHDFCFLECTLPDDEKTREKLRTLSPTSWESSDRVAVADSPGNFPSYDPISFLNNENNIPQARSIIIGHPRGGFKKASFGTWCADQPFPNSSLREYCIPSRPGNSGSPLFLEGSFKGSRLFNLSLPIGLHRASEKSGSSGYGTIFRNWIEPDIQSQLQGQY